MKFLIFVLIVVTACADAQVWSITPNTGLRRSSLTSFNANDFNPYPYTARNNFGLPNSWNRKFDLEFDDDDDWDNDVPQKPKSQKKGYTKREINEFKKRYDRFRRDFDKFSYNLNEFVNRLEQYTY